MIPEIVKRVYEAATYAAKTDNPYVLLQSDVDLYYRDGVLTIGFQGVEYTAKDMEEIDEVI